MTAHRIWCQLQRFGVLLVQGSLKPATFTQSHAFSLTSRPMTSLLTIRLLEPVYLLTSLKYLATICCNRSSVSDASHTGLFLVQLQACLAQVMSGVIEAPSVFGLISGSIALFGVAIDIYDAANGRAGSKRIGGLSSSFCT